ncbi:MAG: class I SAM-dependent methyltransferase [Pseudomonadota bacterium]|nr:class I SAM-dependent methyltransferase [Pseudomonadota bacterium]
MDQQVNDRESALQRFRGDRLQHVLPDFTRTSWASDEAREVWQPRISRIGGAWSAIEWRSVPAGVRRCGLTSVAAERLIERTGEWAAHGLATLPVAMSAAAQSYASTMSTPRTGEPFEYRVAVGRLQDVAALKRAMDGGDDKAIGDLLGYPACCLKFFRDTWVDSAMVDTTWPMAAAGGTVSDDGRTIEISAETPFQANILWRWMGVRAVPHLPCSFDCPATVEFADKLMAVGREEGFDAEMDWLEEILQWPVQWSALHGIAEVKTPVLKASTRTDATAREFTVRKLGVKTPAEAATGLGFPFGQPAHRKATASTAFEKGLVNPIRPEAEVPEWYASDNGFSTRAAMDEAHRPIFELAVESLGESGTVLDLGCGNGALLKKIRDRRPGVIPFGMDLEPQKLAHAGELQPDFRDNFLAGSMFDSVPLDADTVYSLIILMPGRLLEVDSGQAGRLREWLRGHFEHLLVYGYGEWLTDHGGLSGLAAKAGLEIVSQHSSGAAGLARIA